MGKSGFKHQHIKPANDKAGAKFQSEIFSHSWINDKNRFYLPFEEYPETEMWAYSLALTEFILWHNYDARSALEETIQRWYTPGCQKVIAKAVEHQSEAQSYCDSVVKAVGEHKPVPSWPESWAKAIKAYKHNKDFGDLMAEITDFIIEAFNSKKDLHDGQPKVHWENAPFLVQAVTFRSLVEYCEFDPRHWTRYKSVRIGDHIYDIHEIMHGNPSTRKEREIKRNIIKVYKREGYYLCHNHKLLKDAECWYKSRVEPGSIEVYLDELGELGQYPERSYIEEVIAPCDAVTGYPRQWRK